MFREACKLVRDFKRQLAAPGLSGGLRFDVMCHAGAAVQVAVGTPIAAVSAMSGHALTSTTLNTYPHAVPGVNRLTAEAMGYLLE